ncbi:LacI family DNA-binding transcriptional regulator [Gracilimonas mengyeensis]|uniref:Transcriptional regulator, LacI family n=1 Tax=Gracilimonas mengyeensis TaxID=1302730 RepID=A0A521DVU7_9BACT|nr:LacI family DNA-binding transcriptional regulator [Gracilimonas mengyeensis]SMO75826.1 transcriptional regulator, LacI family [Gracilimonas mengyeensis]
MPATIYDIAKKAGVSIATVSRVFNNSAKVSDKARTKVMKVADEMGYHPQAYAQGLASRKNNTVMIVVPVISNYFFMEVLSGVQDKLSQLNYELSIFNISPNKDIEEQVEHVLKRRWAEGYLFISIHLEDSQWENLKRYNVPITLIDEHYEGFDSVSVDNAQGAYRAAKSFFEQGYKRVAMLSALETSKPIRDRMKGYKKALNEFNLSFDEKLVVKGDSMQRDGFTERAGYEAMTKILDMKPMPEACFCASDIQAVGALKAMQDTGKRIPIIGYDDIELAEYMGLSTIRQPMRDMGFFATQNLIDRMNNPEKAISQTIYSPELVARSSTEVKNKKTGS